MSLSGQDVGLAKPLLEHDALQLIGCSCSLLHMILVPLSLIETMKAIRSSAFFVGRHNTAL